MTKKEQAEMELLRIKLALRMFPEVEPDVEITDGHFSELAIGYHCNAHSKRIEKSCSTKYFNGIGRTDKTTSQGAIELYSTKKLAYQAMLGKLSMMYARELREVEKKMEAADVEE